MNPTPSDSSARSRETEKQYFIIKRNGRYAAMAWARDADEALDIFEGSFEGDRERPIVPGRYTAEPKSE